MPRKRKAAGRKATNPSPAKRAKLNPKSNKKLAQTQAMDASSNNKVAQANPPSPVSSCASSAANSPSPSNRTQLTLIEDAKSGFVDKLIEMKVVLIAIIKRNTLRSSVTTAVYADQTGDIQQVIWED